MIILGSSATCVIDNAYVDWILRQTCLPNSFSCLLDTYTFERFLKGIRYTVYVSFIHTHKPMNTCPMIPTISDYLYIYIFWGWWWPMTNLNQLLRRMGPQDQGWRRVSAHFSQPFWEIIPSVAKKYCYVLVRSYLLKNKHVRNEWTSRWWPPKRQNLPSSKTFNINLRHYLKAPTFYQDSLSSAMWSSCEAPFVDDFCCICCFW